MKIKSTLYLILLLLICCKAFGGKPTVYNGNASAPVKNGLYKFSGKLNNRIPIFMWLVVKDSVIKGEVTYTKTKSPVPIKLAGTITKTEGLAIYEFAKDGIMTGIYKGQINVQSFTGDWYSPGSDKDLKYTLLQKDTLLNKIDTALKPVSITGQYVYHWGKRGGDGSIDIKRLTGNNINASINCVTGSPENNIADVEPFKAKINRNTIIFKIPDTSCKFRMKVFKDFIVIDRITETGECGFGMNASIKGVFFKTSNTPKI